MLCQELVVLTTYPMYGHVHILTRKVSITSYNHHHHSHPPPHHQCHHILTRKVGVGISHQLRLIRVKRSQVPGPLLLHISTLDLDLLKNLCMLIIVHLVQNLLLYISRLGSDLGTCTIVQPVQTILQMCLGLDSVK